MDEFTKEKLTNQFAWLLRLLENVDEVFLKKQLIPEKWSVHEHLAHLGRYQEIFLERLGVILNEEAPYLERYKAEADPKFYDWCDYTSEEIIEKTILTRKEIVARILDLTAAQIQAIGIHPKLGRMNVEEWTTFFLLHEAHHIYAIFGFKHRFYITEN